ncbi:hypothetical protein SynMVIR181_02967 [Synechococcus sp. MVIR-18-1]|nr:hypothetical protein SynMVIR181_02967 [Synechococcus sp. MVIR-18-1]
MGSPAQLGKLDLSGFRLKAVPISAGFALVANAEKEIKGLAGRLSNPNLPIRLRQRWWLNARQSLLKRRLRLP